jgi:hypothetical protein
MFTRDTSSLWNPLRNYTFTHAKDMLERVRQCLKLECGAHVDESQAHTSSVFSTEHARDDDKKNSIQIM